MRYPTIDRLAARERLARGYSSASAESDGDDPNDPVVVSEQDWLAAIAIAKSIQIIWTKSRALVPEMFVAMTTRRLNCSWTEMTMPRTIYPPTPPPTG